MSAASGSGPSDAQLEVVQSWFDDNFLDGETQLFGGPNTALEALDTSSQVCDGLPSLITWSTTVKPNGACPVLFTDMNASCTCLNGVKDSDDVWEFRVQLKNISSTPSYPSTLAVTDTLEVDVIQTLYVPATLKKLSIIGVGDLPLSIPFVPEYRKQPGRKLPIAKTLGSTISLTTIEVANIDMFTTVTTISSFMPSSTTSLSLRNCNITSFGYEFTAGMNNLTQFDLSSNNMASAYAGTGNQNFADRCSLSLCGLEEYNLSYNKLTEFPSTPFNVPTLQKFYIQGNDISNFTVNTSIYEKIVKLSDFKANLASDSAECPTGEWKSAHGAKFCVTDDSSAALGESSNNMNPLVFVIMAGVIVVVLLMCILAWQWFSYRQDKSRESHSSATSPSHFYSIFASNFEGHETMRVRLAADPMFVTHRLDYGEVKLGQCISRGGFGLVFDGTYRGRQVAVKKIRVNSDTEAAQIEQFVKEIALMAVLRHPRIVEFIGVAWEEVVDLSAVTELMERGDLITVLHNCRQSGYRLTWGDHKASIALHIAEALMYLHSLSPKVIHRDLKSKNVLINTDMEAKLSDFGISRERHIAETHMTAGMGTSFWIAPEVLSGEDYDEKADIFSFGVVLSELDTDDFPYWNAAHPPGGKLQEGEILQLVANGKMRPSFSPGCPTSILELAHWCLQWRPENRPSAVELVQLFEELNILELSSSSMDSGVSSLSMDSLE